jgi:hypothetical protein
VDTVTRPVVTNRRTHVLRHTPARVKEIVDGYYRRGVLLTRPSELRRFPNGEIEVCFDVSEHVAQPRASLLGGVRRLWARPGFRRFVYVAIAVATPFVAGYVAWLLFADEITAAFWLLVKGIAMLAVVLIGISILLRLLGGGGGNCPGAHCPPGMH